MSINTKNISERTVSKLQILSEFGLPIDIINYCVKPYLEHDIFVVIEIQNPVVNVQFQREIKTHKFTLSMFEELCKTKSLLIKQIIDSNLATIKFIKNKYTYFTFHRGFGQYPLEYLTEIKKFINDAEDSMINDRIEEEKTSAVFDGLTI